MKSEPVKWKELHAVDEGGVESCVDIHNTKNTCIQIQSLKLTVHHQVAPMKWNTNSQHLRF